MRVGGVDGSVVNDGRRMTHINQITAYLKNDAMVPDSGYNLNPVFLWQRTDGFAVTYHHTMEDAESNTGRIERSAFLLQPVQSQ